MARCRVCDHAERNNIDVVLASGSAPIRRIAADYTLSESSVRRHRANHLAARLARSAEAKRVAESDDLGEQVRALRAKAIDLLQQAEIDGDTRTALAAIRETRGLLELMARVQGQLDNGTSVAVNVALVDSWPQLRTVILRALEPHAEARADVLAALADETRLPALKVRL